MNEILAKRMRRRKFKSKVKNIITTIFVLALFCSAGFFAFSYFANASSLDASTLKLSSESKEGMNNSKEKSKSNNNSKLKNNNEEDDDEDNEELETEIEEDKYDVLTIRNFDYLTEATLDGFEMETKNLKIVTEKGVAIDSSETQYIFYYCIFNEVENLDLSEAKFLFDEFTPHIFVSCSTMKKVIMPDDIKLIGKYAFYGWDSLEEINLPTELLEIEDGAFSGCSSLLPVTFGPVIEKIGEQAFLGCEQFTNIELPDSVKFIGRFSFADCENLEELTLPNNDDLELSGLIMSQKDTVISVYYGSKAYKDLVPLSENGTIYNCKNKVLVKPVVTRNSLNKMPKTKIIKSSMNIGFDMDINDFIDVDIQNSGAISYKVVLKDDIKLKDLKKGMNTVLYTIYYYLSDIDVSEIKDVVTKVDMPSEVYNAELNEDTDSRFFVLATKYSEDGKIKIKVENHASKLSKDVKKSTIKYSKFMKMTRHDAYMSGFKDGTFRPNDTLTNGEVAAIIARLEKFDDTKEYSFTYYDVNPSSWLSKYVGYVTERKIMTGLYNSFRPNEKITRGEFVVAIAKMLGLKESKTQSSFADVWGKPGEEYIASFEKLNVIKGLPNGSFGYGKTITRAEAAKIINSVTKREVNTGNILDDIKDGMNFSDVNDFNWFYLDVLEATQTHDICEMH